MTRCVVIVFDSGAIGALPNAASYGNRTGANTIGNVAADVGGAARPNFERFVAGCRGNNYGVAMNEPAAVVAWLGACPKGKDTITGHWETAGIHTDVPIPTCRGGFPPGIARGSVAASGAAPLGNLARMAPAGTSSP